MDQQLEKYIRWYKSKRKEFIGSVYIDKSSWIKRKLLPFSNWDSEHVLAQESNFALYALAELDKFKPEKNPISLAVLILSNRAEYISDQSDFYTTYATLIILSLTVMGITMPVLYKILFSLFVFGGVIYCLHKRLVLRTEVAMNREIVNLLKQYEQRHA